MRNLILILGFLISAFISYGQNTVSTRRLLTNTIEGRDSNKIHMLDNTYMDDTLFFKDGTWQLTAANSTSEVVLVATSGAQYNSIKMALDSILDASAAKPYIIRVAPGVYYEDPFTLKQWVAIEGSGFLSTMVYTNDSTVDFITGSPYAFLSKMMLLGPTNMGKATIRYSSISGVPLLLQELLIGRGYYGVRCDPTGVGVVHCTAVANIWTGRTIHEFMRVENNGNIVNINCSVTCDNASPAVTHGWVCEGSNARMNLDLCSFKVSNSTDAFYVDNGGIIRTNSCVLSRGNNAIHIGPTGHSMVRSFGTTIRRNGSDYFNKSIYIESPTASMIFSGIADASTIQTVTPDSLHASFMNLEPNEEGFSCYGELWLGTDSTRMPLREYTNTTALTGYVSGGKHSRLGGRVIRITPGEGYINDNAGVIEVIWDADTLTYPANSLSYTFVDRYGVVQNSTSEPDKNLNIVLGVVRTDASQVVSIARYKVLIQNTQTNLYDYLIAVGGPLAEDGNVASEYLGASKKISVSGGHYYISTDHVTTSTHSPITFTYWYKGAVPGTWEFTTGKDTINRFKYDISTGTLADVTSGKFKKDALYINYHNDTTEYHIVYGQERFNDVATAITGAMPLVPSDLEDHSLLSAGIISGPDSTTIVTITDNRPFVGSRASAVSTPVTHNDLLGLNAGDYKHLTAAEFTGNGTGNFARTTNVTLVTPNIGAATASSLTIGASTGIAKLTAGVVGIASSGTDYSLPITVTSPLNLSTPTNIEIPVANGSTNGYLSSTNWTTFNNKYGSGDTAVTLATKPWTTTRGFITAGTASSTYLPLAGGTMTGNILMGSDTTKYGTTNQYHVFGSATNMIIHTMASSGRFMFSRSSGSNLESMEIFMNGTTSQKISIVKNSLGYTGNLNFIYNAGKTRNWTLPDTTGTLLISTDTSYLAQKSWVTSRGYITTGSVASGYQPLSAKLTSLSGLTYVSTSFVKMTAAGTFALDVNTYSLTSHTHAGVYEPVIAAGTTAQYWRGDKTWQTLPVRLTASATLDFPLTGARTNSDLTITLTGAVASEPVVLGVPNGSVLANSCYTAWVSATNTVTVRFSNYDTGNLNPTSGTFSVTVIR